MYTGRSHFNGFSGNPLCTATESGVPAGYISSSCSASLSVGGCMIVNTQIAATPTPMPGAVGGFVDVTTGGDSGSSTLLVIGAFLAIAMAGSAVLGHRRATIR